MKIELSNGKTIDMPIEKFIDLSDDEYEDFIERMMAQDAGYSISDVFSNIYIPSTTYIVDDTTIEPLSEEEIERIQNEIEDV